jgi:hypothetical protein
MELLLIVEKEMPEFVRRREILTYGSMVCIDADDCLGLISVQETRNVILQGLMEDPGALSLRNYFDWNWGLGDFVGR